MQAWLRNRSLRAFVAWSTCFSLAMPSAVIAGDGPFRLVGRTSKPTAVEQLAERIDHMERSLDEYGSIVIKTPDVWGESRLMRHRSDVENQLKARLDGFQFRINAVQSTRDAAFLATAIALQEKIGTGVGALTTDSTSTATKGLVGDPNVVGTAVNPNMVPRHEFLNQFAATDGTANKTLNIGIEPVIELDQVNRYLQHLNELRRLNEGDDNADTPGYALNLIRIPVSVLPGRKTEEGFGAEVQITIDPYISDEILPLAFKDFVINGVLDRIGFQVFQMAESGDISTFFEESTPIIPQAPLSQNPIRIISSTSNSLLADIDKSELRMQYGAMPTSELQDIKQGKTKGEIDIALQELRDRQLADVNKSNLAIAASHHSTVNGDTLRRIAIHAYYSLVRSPSAELSPSERVEYGLTFPEVQTLLLQELRAAHDFLAEPSAEGLWHEFCTIELAHQIREHRRDLKEDGKAKYLGDLQVRMGSDAESLVQVDPSYGVHQIRERFFLAIQQRFPQVRGTVTEALAWQIIVESSLQNERLVKDMKETASLKNCPCISQGWMPFFGPDPIPEARFAFKEYVKCKWPIHVFALDPVTQDQNIADSFSQRREMQMSLAIAAANQGLGGQALSRFVRRMEYDLETIELNRTAIAFSHGDNTFGWRFYPRVQAPPVPSNLQATVNDLLIGGQSRDSLVRTRKLEPGIRECTALVVMPSFVPQVTVDVRSNYFRLAKHTPIHEFMHRKPGYESSIELSRELTELRCLQQKCINDAHLYRDGEVFRLCKAVERLDERLPLQTHNVTVPWENDLGGFEVFQSGTQVLEPELHGWYGAPGIIVLDQTPARNAAASYTSQLGERGNLALKLSIEKAKTPADATVVQKITDEIAKKDAEILSTKQIIDSATLAKTDTAILLVGKNFSVLNCQVIAGGVDVSSTVQVINRNLIRVIIPSDVSTVFTGAESNKCRSVVVHLATPHGATSRLLIPVAGNSEATNAEKALEAANAAKSLAEDAQSKLAEAIAASETSTRTAQRVSSRVPVTILWGEDPADQKLCVKVVNDNGTAKLLHFCPVNDRKRVIPVVEQKQSTPWADPDSICVEGQLALYVSSPSLEGGKRQKVGPWAIKDGKVNDEPLTAETLFSLICGEIGEKLQCPSEDSINLEVSGYVKVKDGQPVIALDNKITFELKLEKKD